MRQRSGWIALPVFALLLAASSTLPHLAAQDAPADRFEVATVKPASYEIFVGVMIQPGGRVLLSRLWLKTLVRAAYRHNVNLIVNKGDAWIEREAWSIEAKVPANSGITNLRYSYYDIEDPRLRQMLQALLAERFQLRVSRETKMGDVYHLVRTNGPLRLIPAKIPEGKESFLADFGSIGWAGRWGIHRVSMEQVAKWAADYYVHDPVVDMTNLSGLYDYKQTGADEQFGTGDAFRIDAANSFLRLLKEVGLELKRTRGPVETLVIESAVRPSPN